MSSFINEDVVDEVLARLPAKEVARVRCVSKRWLSLTSEPGFIQHHSSLNPHPPPSGFFLCDPICGFKHFPLNTNPPALPHPLLPFIPIFSTTSRFFILSSCNGLAIFSQVTRWPRYKSKYYVCNPTTKEFVKLTKPEQVYCYFSLAFDPSKRYGYKVICIGHTLHVFSSETLSWKLSMNKDSLRTFEAFDKKRSVYWNGALIWIGREHLVSFDTDTEIMKRLPSPSNVIYIGESGGKLQMIARPNNESVAILFDILEMDAGCSCWSVLYRVDLSCMSDLYPQEEPPWLSGLSRIATGQRGRRPLKLRPVCFIRGKKEEEDEQLLLSIPRRIISYNLKSREFVDVCDVKFPRPGYYYLVYEWHRFYPLGHTLFSP